MGRPHTPESRAKISAARKGKALSIEHREAISAASKGIPKTVEHKAKIGAAHKGRTNGPHTPEHKAKIKASSIAFGSRPRTAEHTEKIAAAKRGKPLPPKTAEHREKISAAKRGKKRPPFSEEWKENIRVGAKAFGPRPQSEQHKANIVAALQAVYKDAQWLDKQRKHLSRVRPKREPSGLERIIAQVFDEVGISYVAQAPLGWYHVDFLIPGKNIVVECDGSYWHSRPKQIEADRRRDIWLTRHGYTVVRLAESDIRKNALGLIQTLISHHFK